MSDLGRLLILVGLAVAAAGLVVLLAGRIPFVGHLPGDLLWRRGGATIYVPIVTSLLLSLVLTGLLNVAGLIFRH